jgi:TPR repeat protein
MAGGPAGALPPGGCEVPFFDGSDPSTWLVEGRRRCDGGDGDACTALGFVCDRQTWIHYPHGALPAAVLDSASCTALLAAGRQTGACKRTDYPYKEFFGLGCENGNHLACRQIARAAVTRNEKQDRHFVVDAEDDCLRGDPPACSDLANYYFHRRQDAVSVAYANMAKELVACRLAGRPACQVSSDSLRSAEAAKAAAARTPEQVQTDRLAALTRRCDAHDDDACADLARAYAEGPAKDLRRAAELTQRQCAAGSAPACLALSHMRSRGYGVPRDETLAIEAAARARQLAAQGCLQGDGGLGACLTALIADSPEWLKVPAGSGP